MTADSQDDEQQQEQPQEEGNAHERQDVGEVRPPMIAQTTARPETAEAPAAGDVKDE
jgi:hypothetical protein